MESIVESIDEQSIVYKKLSMLFNNVSIIGNNLLSYTDDCKTYIVDSNCNQIKVIDGQLEVLKFCANMVIYKEGNYELCVIDTQTNKTHVISVANTRKVEIDYIYNSFLLIQSSDSLIVINNEFKQLAVLSHTRVMYKDSNNSIVTLHTEVGYYMYGGSTKKKDVILDIKSGEVIQLDNKKLRDDSAFRAIGVSTDNRGNIRYRLMNPYGEFISEPYDIIEQPGIGELFTTITGGVTPVIRVLNGSGKIIVKRINRNDIEIFNKLIIINDFLYCSIIYENGETIIENIDKTGYSVKYSLGCIIINVNNSYYILKNTGEMYNYSDFTRLYDCSLSEQYKNVIKVNIKGLDMFFSLKLNEIDNLNYITKLKKAEWTKI